MLSGYHFKLVMRSKMTLTESPKKVTPRLPALLVLAATVTIVVAAIGGLFALAWSMATIGSTSSSILSENSVLAISTFLVALL
jgi:hypothetical protein